MAECAQRSFLSKRMDTILCPPFVVRESRASGAQERGVKAPPDWKEDEIHRFYYVFFIFLLSSLLRSCIPLNESQRKEPFLS